MSAFVLAAVQLSYFQIISGSLHLGFAALDGLLSLAPWLCVLKNLVFAEGGQARHLEVPKGLFFFW